MIVHGDLHVDAGRREARVGDEEIQLAPKEFDLLWELLDHRGLVLTRDQLLERVWGYTFAGDTRTVDVHVRQLRRKLGDASPIVTVWGVGYKVSPARDAQRIRRRPREAGRVFSSLRVRLPLLFLAGILLYGVVTTLIAIRLFQEFARDQTLSELRREAVGHRAALLNAVDARPRTSGAARRRFAAPTSSCDRRPDLLRRRRRPFPGEKSGLRRARPADDRLDVRRDADVRVHPAGLERTYFAVAHPVGSRSDADRRDRRREAEDGRPPRPRRCSTRLAIAGAIGARSSPRCSPGTCPAASSGRCSHSRAPPTRSRTGNYEVEIPEGGAGEIGHLAERFEQMTDRLAEAETRERNFLMSVSHELRTPLTAIRGHVAALLDGLVEDPEQRDALARGRRGRGASASSASSATSSTSRSSTRTGSRVLREEVDMEQLVELAYETFSEQARRRAIDFRVDVAAAAGDRLRRRPRAPDRRQPALERLPRDAGRRADRASSSAASNGQVRGRGRGHRPRDPARGARAALPGVRLGRRRHRPRSRDREGALDRARRRDRPRVSRSARARASSWCCRLE